MMKRTSAKVEAKTPPEKKVLVFGRCGDGKSTVANALVTGSNHPERFRTSDGARGCTAKVQKETGRGWTVTDTVGLGEAESGTVSSAEAKKRLTDFLKNFKDEYSHIIYVKNAKSKITEMDDLIWLIFASIFEGAEDAFVVLFTRADQKWLNDNRDKLPEYLRNQKLLVVDIPPVYRRSTIIERRRIAIREKSIKDLEENLVKLFDERGNVYSSPDIAKMTEVQLEEKSWSLLMYIADLIRRLYSEASWRSIAAKLGFMLNAVGIVLNIVSVA